jgi:hypothetical protein
MSNLAEARLPAPEGRTEELRVPERAKVAVGSDLVQALHERLVGRPVLIEMPHGTYEVRGVLTDVSVSNGAISLWVDGTTVVPYNQIRKISLK